MSCIGSHHGLYRAIFTSINSVHGSEGMSRVLCAQNP